MKACVNNGTQLSETISLLRNARRRSKKGTENLFKEIMTKNLPNLGKDTAI